MQGRERVKESLGAMMRNSGWFVYSPECFITDSLWLLFEE